MKNSDKGNSACTDNEDNLYDLRLGMESANDKYKNAVKKLSDMQENYKKQNKNVLLVRRQSRSCVVQGNIGKYIYDSLDVKINELDQM